MPQKWYFERFEGFLVYYLVLYFSISLLRSFFAFVAEFSFSFAGNLEGFILVGKCFGKAFRILGLDERKGRWVEEQDFHGNFLVNVTMFFTFSTLCVTELSLFWYGLKDLFTLHKSAVKVVLDH